MDKLVEHTGEIFDKGYGTREVVQDIASASFFLVLGETVTNGH